mgnify:CR=1 FL=1
MSLITVIHVVLIISSCILNEYGEADMFQLNIAMSVRLSFSILLFRPGAK